VDPPSDFRVAISPSAGAFPHWASLHEFGHAAQGLLAPAEGARLLRRTACDAVSEACGKLAERLVFSPEWLERQGVPEADRAALQEWERRSERARMRGILADTAFEERLYADPTGDLDAACTEVQARLAGVRVSWEMPGWTVERTLLLEPLGRFDYLLARCAQAAVYRRLRALPGGLLGEEAGRVLQEEVLAPAAGATFADWFRRAAGREPDCSAWIEDVAGLPAPPG
jgi:hypothetical protein